MVMVTGVVAISVGSLVKEQRFKSGVHMVAEKILLGEQLMLIQGSDIQLVFHKDPKKTDTLLIDLFSTKSLSKGTSLLLEKTKEIPGIGSCSFVTFQGKQESLPFIISFNSTAHELSQGTIFLSAYDRLEEEGPLKQSLFLPGYITPLGANISQSSPVTNAYQLFPKEVMESWSSQQKETPK